MSSIDNLDFGLSYSTIDICIYSATNLPKETFGESDPYVKVEIIGGTCKCKKQKLRTETRDNHEDPVWKK